MGQLTRVRVRRLPNVGLFRHTRLYEIQITEPGETVPARTEQTKRPYSLLKPMIGWDEAAFVAKRAGDSFPGGDTPGPWVDAGTGAVSDT